MMKNFFEKFKRDSQNDTISHEQFVDVAKFFVENSHMSHSLFFYDHVYQDFLEEREREKIGANLEICKKHDISIVTLCRIKNMFK